MEYEQIYQVIVIISFLLLVLLGAVSFRFLNQQYCRSREVDPEVLAQYTVNLEVEQFLDLIKDLEKDNTP